MRTPLLPKCIATLHSPLLRKCIALLALFIALCPPLARAELAYGSCTIDAAESEALQRQVASMFDYSFSNYMTHAFPKDELRPLSCGGVNTFGGLSMTLIDTLDSLILFGRYPDFVRSVHYLRANLSFDRNASVSVFETTIRVLGGLLSAHGLLTDAADAAGFDAWLWYPNYDDSLLYLAVDIADRLMPAFDTPTGIPVGAINLRHGVASDESRIASTAGAGSLLLELGTLSVLTGDRRYYDAAFRAMSSLHSRAAPTGLVGNHIDVDTGEWTADEAGIGGLIDSFYEYMLKGGALFGDPRLHAMFADAYPSVLVALHEAPWYLTADMNTAARTSFETSSLSAFWPGLQTLAGHLRPAAATARATHAIWRRLGALPEAVNVRTGRPIIGRAGYPLRPEHAEAVFYLGWATGDPAWRAAARSIMFSLETLGRARCGYARLKGADTHVQEDLMDSFFPSETLKYLFLALGERGGWLRSGKFIFTTEAHPLPVRPVPFKLPGLAAGERRAKCPRRRNVDRAAACGFGLPGSDRPPRPVARFPRVPKDIAAQLRKKMASADPDFRDGEVFLGSTMAFAVTSFPMQMALIPLGGAALRAVRAASSRQKGWWRRRTSCPRETPVFLLHTAVCRS